MITIASHLENLAFMPHFPLHLNSLFLFGTILLLGLIGGEVIKYGRYFPSIIGFIAIGYLAGPGGLDIANKTVLANTRIFVDISLSLILFELGRNLSFAWLRNDRGLLATSITESLLTLLSVFSVLYFVFDLAWTSSLIAAIIAIATSPAIVMMVANDLRAEGPVTRRALILTSLNNLIALTLFILVLPLTEKIPPTAFTFILYSGYRLLGSILLGLLVFLATVQIGKLIGKEKESQFVLIVGSVVLTIGCAYMLKLPSMMSLFILGMAVRNFDYKHILMELDFGWLARLFFILLFVVTGVQLNLKGLWEASLAVGLFLLVRLVAKTVGICLFAKSNRMTQKQTIALSLALFPMAGVALGMSNILSDFNPEFSQRTLEIVSAVIAILNIIGPIFTQIAFVVTGEALATVKQGGIE